MSPAMKPPVITLHKAYSTDGIELDCILFSPHKRTNKLVIHVHGKEGHFIQNHFVTGMGTEYPRHGYAFLTFNNRGHDYMADLLKKTSTGYIWEQGGSVYDILEHAQYDIDGILDLAVSLGFTEIILQGHSLGPHKICYWHVSSGSPAVRGLIFLTTADVRYQFDTSIPDWHAHSVTAKRLVDEGRGRDLMPVRLWSNCPVSAATFWNYTRPDTNCFVFNGTHPEIEYKNFNRITLPILVVNPENDAATGIPQKKALTLIGERSASRDLSLKMIPDAVHGFLGKEDALISEITGWLDRHA